MYGYVRKNRDCKVNKAALNHNRNVRGCDFKPNDRVWMLDSAPQKGLNQKLRPRWKGPFTVIDKTNDVNVLLKPDGRKKKTIVCHMSRLKRCFGKPLPKLSNEKKKKHKRRGRPANEFDSVPALLEVPVKSVESAKTKSLCKKTLFPLLNSERVNLDPEKSQKSRKIRAMRLLNQNHNYFIKNLDFLIFFYSNIRHFEKIFFL